MNLCNPNVPTWQYKIRCAEKISSLEIETQFYLEFYSWTFVHNYIDHFTEVPFRNTLFTIKVVAAYEQHDQMQINVTWTQPTEEEQTVTDALKSKLVEKAVDFVNYIIYHARTFDLQTSNMVLVSPRTNRTIPLKARENGKLIFLSEFLL